jgi:hypothetical protein
VVLIRSALAVLRFVLEVCLVAAYAYFGFTFPGAAGVILGIGLPAILIVVWGLFVAPKATRRLQGLARFIVETTLFLLGAGALAAVGRWEWGIVLFIVFALDWVLLEWLGKPAWATPSPR